MLVLCPLLQLLLPAEARHLGAAEEGGKLQHEAEAKMTTVSSTMKDSEPMTHHREKRGLLQLFLLNQAIINGGGIQQGLNILGALRPG